MSSNVRVRVAPSPTGDPHIGTAYQALFNYAFARRHGGQFILRIEDTDRERSHTSSERAILESLRWLGLQWDEGPDVGGPHGPYRQSERLEVYQEAAQRLLDSGHAYRDFMTREELQALRQKEQENKTFEHYERRDRDLPPEESAARAAAGEVHTVRLKVPTEGECVLQDLLRGEIRREWSIIDDQVLLKSDGFPTYHLANVVDDHEMSITHVIRGEEWINSVPKHLLLYSALGWEPPVFCHLPLLRNNDANKTKLSKRKNPTSIHYFRDAGFLAPCLVNYLALMGISKAEGEEKMALDDFVDGFELEDVSLGGPVFDIDKLRWLNARYIREDLSPVELRDALRDWALSDENLDRIVPLAQPRLQTLSDWGYLTAFFFADDVSPDPDLLTLKGRETAELTSILQIVTWRLEQLRDWTLEGLEETLRDCCERFELKMRDFTRPLYVALSGSTSSTPLFDSMLVLGPDLTRMRLRRAVDALGGLSKKRLKATEKQMQALWPDA